MKKKENTVVATKSNVTDTNYFTIFLQIVIVGNISFFYPGPLLTSLFHLSIITNHINSL